MKKLLSLPLRPYAGRLFATCDRKRFTKQFRVLFGDAEGRVLEPGVLGRFSSGNDLDGKWSALVYAETAWDMAHELAHVASALFKRCGIPIDADNDEPFCYLLSQMMEDTRPLYERAEPPVGKARPAKKRK